MFVQEWEDEPGFLPLCISQAALEISQISQVLASLSDFLSNLLTRSMSFHALCPTHLGRLGGKDEQDCGSQWSDLSQAAA